MITTNAPSISEDEWTSLWSKCSENTGTGDSGLHFAMFKTNCLSKNALFVDHSMAQLSYQHGYSLQRWQRSINVLIQKKNRSVLADKQRIIHLWEADANALFKILARQTTRLAERNNMFAPEQYGSRPKHSAAALSLAKRLTFDIARQRRQTMAICCNDAAQCYDRMVHTPTALALRRVGMAAGPVNCMFSMIQSLHHFVRTAHGTSEQSFSSSTIIDPRFQPVPLQGIGQGNGCGPTAWAMLSSVLLDVMRNRGHGAQILQPHFP